MTEELFNFVHEKTMKFLDEFSNQLSGADEVLETDFSKVVHTHIAILLSSLIAHIPESKDKGKLVDEMFKKIINEVNILLHSIKPIHIEIARDELLNQLHIETTGGKVL